MNGSFKFYLTDSLAASVGCFVDESLVEQTEAGERTSDSSHLPQDEHPLRVDVALGYIMGIIVGILLCMLDL